MTDPRDKILKFLLENKDRSFDQNELKKQLFPELNKDQVKEFLYQIIDFKPNLMKVYKESSIGILSVQYNGLIDDFLKNGGFEKIESDLKRKPLDWYKIIPIILTFVFGLSTFYFASVNYDLRLKESRVPALENEIDSLKNKLNRLESKLIEYKKEQQKTTSETKN